MANSSGRAPSDLEAIQALLERLNLRPEQLLSKRATPTMPTFAEYVDRVSAAVPASTLRVYGTYWRKLKAAWGHRTIDEPSPTEVKQFVLDIKGQVVVRRNARGGRTAMEHMVAAFRCLYSFAIEDGYIVMGDNPAATVEKPRRLPSNRYALTPVQLGEINRTAAHSGDDPHLDSLLLRLHEETACRRGGALALRPVDLNRQLCLIRLREKGETERDQPVSPTLMAALLRHVEQRGDGDEQGQVLRTRKGTPITRRRYDYLWSRLGKEVPWVRALGVSSHWLRTTTLTWVERNFGYAVARAYAGHNDRRSNAGTTTTYVRADIYEVAAALSAITKERHPLLEANAPDPWLWRSSRPETT
ncbi:site-specific recombinase XerD [Hamadaea flava]|uniref:Tyrosine-type recombinase/integrase n=1 Tax=Hamadaea flava TaxID=1742688 RepID=A0ABV8LN65_9ACTN|nr:site-specific integrase [Hamadaea flava]MCP2323671.1 site-specific recombinase XerD [Hamadaea flava]